MGFSDAVLPEAAKAQLKADSNPLPSAGQPEPGAVGFLYDSGDQIERVRNLWIRFRFDWR